MTDNLDIFPSDIEPVGLVPDSDSLPQEPVNLARTVWRRFRRHPGALVGSIVLSIIILACLLAPLSPYNPELSDIASALQPPSWKHPFGTDPLGRDLLTRVLYGGRISLFVGFMVVLITLLIGVLRRLDR